MNNTESLSFFIVRFAVWLILIGLLTGLFVGFAMTGTIEADGSAFVAAHLNALMGSFILFGLAYSMPFLKYEHKYKKNIAYLFILSNIANWLITFIKAFLDVKGIEITENPQNNIIHICLILFVVLPSITGAVMWLNGLKKGTKK